MTSQDMAALQKYYRSLRFRRKFTYSGSDLGVICQNNRTCFALWAPIALSVNLVLYPDGTGLKPLKTLAMEKCENGVWRHKEARSLHGTYYEYRIDNGDGFLSSGDPYARACGCNSQRCMVVDLSLTNPRGWDLDQSPPRQAEDIIYELHIKEFSWQEAGGFPDAFQGKYLAFTCPYSTLHKDSIHPTGIAYLKELGVNTVQIMPFFDYGSVDERDDSQFNWGYDPMYYNIPEGSYATDPHRGEIRIRECKQMIQSLHNQGLRVIMDVVYNHTYHSDSPMNRAAPGYYYRHDAEGHPTNGSYCGNDIASERPMVSKFILESVLYWAKEYHVDGFRFDLMGLLDVALMNQIQKELDLQFGEGEKLIYGEPWAAGSTNMEKKSLPAMKHNMGLLNKRIGMFCDNTRDTVKGHVFFSAQPGFIGGAPNAENGILNAARAWCGQIPGVTEPGQIVTYLSCHDNLTLFDKLKVSSPPDRDVFALNRLAAAIAFTCQGHIFMLSGEEFARTKNGNDNSYNAPIELNCLDWQRAWEQEPLREYYRGLISIRKSSPGLCDKTPQARDRFYQQWTRPGAAGYYLDNRGPDGDGSLCVIYNANTVPLRHNLLPGSWEIWADGENSFRWKEGTSVSGCITVPPLSAMILSQDGIAHKGED